MKQKIVNATGHEITFEDDRGRVIKVPPTKYILSVKSEEVVVRKQNGISLIRRTFYPKQEAIEQLEEIKRLHPGKLVVGSILAAQAFPGEVYSLVPAFGFETAAPIHRRAEANRLVTFE